MVVAEAESSKIGQRMIPPALWTRLAEAPRIELVAEAADRARYLATTYADVVADRQALDDIFARLPIRISAERLANWQAMAEQGALADLAEAIMVLHYDPAYDRSRKRHDRGLLGTVQLVPDDPASLAQAVRDVAHLVGELDASALRRDPQVNNGN